MTTVFAMIPARMGSQRLKEKNLCKLNGIPLISHAIRKCIQAGCFSEIWVNSESERFGEIAELEGALFHKRPEHLGDNNATHEQFVYEFLTYHKCDYLLQVHSIAPLLTADQVKNFTEFFINSDHDAMVSCIHDQIECAYRNTPINFTFNEKTNSQDLQPIQRITWSITGWKSASFLQAFSAGKCATFAGSVGFYQVDPISGHVIKTQQDLDIAEALIKVLRE